MTYHHHLPEVNDRVGLIVMTCVFFMLAVVAVGFRFWSRRLSSISFMVDDWLSLSSLVFVLELNSIFLAGTIQGAITGHSAVANDWPVTSPLEHLNQKYKYAFQVTEKLTFGLIKLSVLFLWKRIFSPVRPFRVTCWVMIGIIIVWSLAWFLAAVFQRGIDWEFNWAPIAEFLTQCPNTMATPPAFAATDVLTDIIIIAMPIPQIWRLHMSVRRRVGITAVFLVGVFATAAGVARMYIYLGPSYDTEDNPVFIADVTNFLLWSTIEVNLALYSSCMPTLPPVGHKLWSILTGHHQLSEQNKGSWCKILSARSNKIGPEGEGRSGDSEKGTEYETLAAKTAGSEAGSVASISLLQERIEGRHGLTAPGTALQEHDLKSGLQHASRADLQFQPLDIIYRK